jgi:excisionase family DNA binding protein
MSQNPQNIKFPSDFEQALEMLLEKERENKALRAKLEEQKRNDYPEVLKVKQVAEILGVAEPTVYAYMRHSDFPALQLGGVARVRRDSLFRWLESKERKV